MVLTASSTALTLRLALIALLVVRAHRRRQLTPAGLAAAGATGLVHAVHPWSVFFVLLVVFFIGGNAVTKATLTSSASGTVLAAPHPRSAAQVLCNSLPATLAILLHWIYLDYKAHAAPSFLVQHNADVCLPHPRVTPTATEAPPGVLNALPYAVFAHYAAAAADTFASELGILSRQDPVLITAPWRRVPRGTNGGVSLAGLLASALGAAVIGLTVVASTPFCKAGSTPSLTEIRSAYVHGYTAEGAQDGQRQWLFGETLVLAGWLVFAGVAGALLDSYLGATLQASVVEAKSGKVVEGSGGQRVQHSVAGKKGASVGRRLLVGRDVLSNNGVNLAMSSLTAAGAWAVAAIIMGATPVSVVGDVLTLAEVLRLEYASSSSS